MNHHEIAEVRRTWELASSRMPHLSQLFRVRMLMLNPRRRVIFGDDAETNARMLLRLVGIAVNGLNQPRVLFPLLETLGRQNARRIINARQGCVTIRALLWSLRAALGPAYNDTVRHAWTTCYRAVARAMAVGMAEAESESGWNAASEMQPITFEKIAVPVHLMRLSTASARSARPQALA